MEILYLKLLRQKKIEIIIVKMMEKHFTFTVENFIEPQEKGCIKFILSSEDNIKNRTNIIWLGTGELHYRGRHIINNQQMYQITKMDIHFCLSGSHDIESNDFWIKFHSKTIEEINNGS